MAKTALLIRNNRNGNSKYRPEMPEKLIKHMRTGRGVLETSLYLGITPVTLYEWTNPNSNMYEPAMDSALSLGKALSEVWWLEQGRKHLVTKKNFNHVLWYMNMKNRFGWRDNVDLTSDGSPIAFTNAVPRPKPLEVEATVTVDSHSHT